MNKVINRNIQLRSVGKTRTAEFVISSEAVDSYNTVFRKDGWMLQNYRKNPIVTYNHSLHSDNPDNIIGTSEVFFDGDLLIGRVTFEPANINPIAEKIFRKVKTGTIKMASVGANILGSRFGNSTKGEDPDVLYFTRIELLEWSIVPAGSNPDAHKRNLQFIDQIRADLSPRTVRQAQLIINKNKTRLII